MTYDDSDRLVGLQCAARDDSYGSTTTLTFDGVELVEVTNLSWAFMPPYFPEAVEEEETDTWTLGDTVTRTRTGSLTSCAEACLTSTFETVETYERDGFRFDGHPADLAVPLEAPDFLLSTRTTSMDDGGDPPRMFAVDYTYDGLPREGTRTRTGSDGSVYTFQYDAEGRLLEVEAIPDEDSLFEVSYTYDGELLIEIYRRIVEPSNDDFWTEYEHDAHGNLIRRLTRDVDPPDRVTDFSYDCW